MGDELLSPLSGSLLPAFRPTQDNGGDEMLSPFSSEVVSPVYNFSAQVKFEILISLSDLAKLFT